MSQCLPYRRFKQLNQKEIDKFDVNSISENSFDGYVLEFDLEYPDELHGLHNYYPLAPEKLEINHDMQLNYCSSIANKYLLLYRNLQLYLSLGMKLIVYGISKFKQSDWLKKYTDFNTDKKKNASNSFEKKFLN